MGARRYGISLRVFNSDISLDDISRVRHEVKHAAMYYSIHHINIPMKTFLRIFRTLSEDSPKVI